MGILLRCVERRARFCRKVPVRPCHGPWEHVLERPYEIAQGLSLLPGPGVLRLLAVGIETSDVAHANRRGVVSLAMGTHLGNRSATLHLAIQSHHEMVANRFKTLLPMPAVDVGSSEVHALASGGAMDND